MEHQRIPSERILQSVYRSFELREGSRTVSFDMPIYVGISTDRHGHQPQDRSVCYQRATVFTLAKELWVVSFGSTTFDSFRADLLALTLRRCTVDSKATDLLQGIQNAFSEVHGFQRSCFVACVDGRFRVNYRFSRLGERVFETLKCKGDGVVVCQDVDEGDFRCIEPCAPDSHEVSDFLSQQLLNVFADLSV